MNEGVRPDPVKLSSDWMAVLRAREHSQPDAYLSDPCAAAFVTPAAETGVDTLGPGALPSAVVPIRARLGDLTLLSSGVRQAVSLGSGTDCRAYRLPLEPGVVYYEIDLPGQLTGKAERLAAAGFAPRCGVRVVEADLRRDWAPQLVTAGFSPAEPAHWIAEGLLSYLSAERIQTLLAAVSSLAAPGSWLTFDIPHERFLRDPVFEPFLREMGRRGVPYVGALADPAETLAGFGWSASAVLHRELATGGCRWLPPLPERLRTPPADVWLVRAHRP
ncbi:class I SAM-dependent methyltransferase [Nonomuraea typhae]|uniref:class I SAM-dependent methyltransferase n=1 Tax=Nonomuraea typhae TaxID=2603600 RepID=UPI0012F7767E|nr:SAM-dependent methyltransferase [Nonomuraea typhae]